MSILTHDEAKRLSQSSTDPLEVIRNVEAAVIESAVIAKLAQGVDIPKPAIETTAFSRDSSTQHYYTADQLRTCIAAARVKAYAAAGASPVEPSQAPQGCACRWDAEDNRIATCTRHQGWLDVVQEWADRAKVAEAKQAQPPAPGEAAITYMTGYSDGREWAGATSQAQPERAPLSDEQKCILFECVEQVKDGNELDYYLLGFEAAENAYGIKQGGQQ